MRIVTCLILGLAGSCFAQVALADSLDVTFDTTSDTLSISALYQVVETGLTVDGVTFDATLSVTSEAFISGSWTSDSVYASSSGLGSGGDGADSLIDNERLIFTMAISNVSGGTVAFDWFTDVDMASWSAGEKMVVKTTGGTTLTTYTGATPSLDISGSELTAFILEGGSATSGTTSFYVESVGARFTGTPVPEPGTLTLLGLALAGTGALRRRARATK